MTLIIGIKCRDGIVMGADGAATLGALGHQTIRQETEKLDILENRIIVGVSGPVGLGQRIRAEVHALWTDSRVKLGEKKPEEAMKIIREALWEKHIGPEMRIAQVAAATIGQPFVLQSALAHTIVCLPLNGIPSLIQLDQQGSPEHATETLPFVAIGSGQSIADPFLAFLRRIFWAKSLPTLHDGIFSALWTLQHAIQTNAGGVAEPVQIVVLEKTQNSPWKARKVGNQELQEHLVAIQAYEDHLANFRNPRQETENDLQIPVPERVPVMAAKETKFLK